MVQSAKPLRILNVRFGLGRVKLFRATERARLASSPSNFRSNSCMIDYRYLLRVRKSKYEVKNGFLSACFCNRNRRWDTTLHFHVMDFESP
jgi:hypothetical protein